MEHNTKKARGAAFPSKKRLSGRLEALLEALFAECPDPRSLFMEIAAELRPADHLPLQKMIKRTMHARGALSPDCALLVASVLARTGFPPLRILHFLSLYLPGTVGLSQFEFAASAMFPDDLPITETMLYDLTQYTYLEKRLLVRKSMEISARLKDSLSPELLLYLYLLSLRDDMSNENVHLVGLIMKSCFPALEVRLRLGDVPLEEYGEMAKTLRHAAQNSFSLEHDRGAAARPFDRGSASFFLDKYFSDASLERQHGEAAAAVRTSPGIAARPRRRANAALSPVRARYDAPTEEPAAVRASPAPQRRPGARVLKPAPIIKEARLRLPGRLPGRLPLFAPLCAAAVVALGFTVLAVCVGPLSRAPQAEPAPVVAAAAPAFVAPASVEVPEGSPDVSEPPAQPQAPPARRYVVQRGDNLWKIYRSLGNGRVEPTSWAEFLSQMSVENGIVDPDLIQPGRVLTVQPAQP